MGMANRRWTTRPLTEAEAQPWKELACSIITTAFVDYVVGKPDSETFQTAARFFCSEFGELLIDGVGQDPVVVRDALDARREEAAALIAAGDYREFRRWCRAHFPTHNSVRDLWPKGEGDAEERVQHHRRCEAWVWRTVSFVAGKVIDAVCNLASTIGRYAHTGGGG